MLMHLLLQESPITLLSHALRGRNLLLSTYEKGMLALVLAVQMCRPHLLRMKFLVQTVHCSLKHLWNQKITTAAQQKWLYKLMGFSFDIEYKSGKENIVAGVLSRREDSIHHKKIKKLLRRKWCPIQFCKVWFREYIWVKHWDHGSSGMGLYSSRIKSISQKLLLYF